MNRYRLVFAVVPALLIGLASLAHGQVPRPGDDDDDILVESDKENDDTRIECVVFELHYDRRVNFKDKYLEKFNNAYWESVDGSPTFRTVTKTELFQRMKDSGMVIIPNPLLEDAVKFAKKLDIPYVLWVEINPIGTSKFQILLTLVHTKDDQRFTQEKTVSKDVKGVEKTIRKLTKEILAAEP